ncbi:hypothetical protein CDD83_11150 [Cordyceps sp. RAO-2017]|nr:hypothetical protein CDD83_11150 [Cordyceps sp. RAO-2017]
MERVLQGARPARRAQSTGLPAPTPSTTSRLRQLRRPLQEAGVEALAQALAALAGTGRQQPVTVPGWRGEPGRVLYVACARVCSGRSSIVRCMPWRARCLPSSLQAQTRYAARRIKGRECDAPGLQPRAWMTRERAAAPLFHPHPHPHPLATALEQGRFAAVPPSGRRPLAPSGRESALQRPLHGLEPKRSESRRPYHPAPPPLLHPHPGICTSGASR